MPMTTALAERATRSPRNFGVDRSLIPLLIGFVLLLGVGSAIAWLVGSARTQSELLFDAFEVQRSALRIFRTVQAAETGQRGALLTGEDRYLEPYRSAVKLEPEIMSRLVEQTASDAEQHADALALQDLVARKLAELAHTVELAQSGETAQALQIVKTDLGRELMDQIRASVDRILQRAINATNAEFERGQALNRALLWTALAALLGILAVGVLVIRLNRRAMSGLQERQQMTAALNDTLEEAVRERTAELMESNEEIQRFAYIVSHDLRSPLVNVMGFTSELEALKGDLIEAASRPADDPSRTRVETEFDEAIGYVKSAINKMEGLIAAILRLSREGHRTFRPERVETEALMQDLAKAQKHQADAAGAMVIVARHLPTVVADRVALQQIFGNLLDNAVKYLDRSRPGRIEITGETIGERARITVRDNGRGIAPTDHRRVFELFRRSGPQDRPGEGIGLAHVQTLVRSLGGRITLDSELGKGTAFTVVLPLAPNFPPEGLSLPETSMHPVTIVMIEDDEGHARLIERNIRRAGVNNQIVPFANGTDALQYLFDPAKNVASRHLLILLDLNLPDMTGIDILQKIKADANTKRSPVVVLTTTDDQREIQRCYDLGANVYITKPVNYEGFANAIRQLGLFFSVMQVPSND